MIFSYYKLIILIRYMNEYKNMTLEDFMNFFRDVEKLTELTVEERVEIFQTILLGSSDFTERIIK